MHAKIHENMHKKASKVMKHKCKSYIAHERSIAQKARKLKAHSSKIKANLSVKKTSPKKVQKKKESN